MKQIRIIFGSPDKTLEDLELTWELLSHPAAAIWFKLFLTELSDKRTFFFRYTGFVNHFKDQNYLLSELQKHIDLINKDGRYFIPQKASDFDQYFANKIHHHFEVLAGDYDRPAVYWHESSDEVKNAVSGLNYCIHDLEAYSRNLLMKENPDVFSTVVLEIKESNRIMIPGAFYKLFTMNIEFGDLVAHYSQIGKTWLEAFYDNDREIFEEAIRPHYALSGEFDILFGRLSPDENFFNDLKKYLALKGKDINDPALRLGHLPLAKLTECTDPLALKEKVGIRPVIRKITAIADGQIIAQKLL